MITKRFSNTSGLLALALAACVTAGAQAATLATYDFGPSTAGFTTAATSTAAGFNSTPLSPESGLDGFISSGVNFAGAPTAPAAYFRVTSAQTSIAAAVNANAYFTVTLAPVIGNVLDLSGVNWVGNLATGNSAKNISLQIDIGSGFVDVGTHSFLETSKSNVTTDAPFESVSFDLSSYSGITTAAQLRFVLWDDVGGVTNGSSMRMDDFTITGDIRAIPEPSVALLSGLGVLALFARRRA